MENRLEFIDALLESSRDPETLIDRLYDFAVLLRERRGPNAEIVLPPALRVGRTGD